MNERFEELLITFTNPTKDYLNYIYKKENYNKYGTLIIRPIMLVGGTLLLPYVILANICFVISCTLGGLLVLILYYICLSIYNFFKFCEKLEDRLDKRINNLNLTFDKIFKNESRN